MNSKLDGTQQTHGLFAIAATVAMTSGGCGEPSTPDVPVVESFGTDGQSGATSEADGTNGGSGAGDGVDDTAGDGDSNAGECYIEEIPGQVGERYQCKGDFTAFFGADGVEEQPFPVSFGDSDDEDSYEKPFVAACCGPLVEMPNCPGGDVNQHIWACYMDAIQQMCVGLGTKVEELRNNVPLGQGFIKPSLEKLRDWVNLGTTISECQDVFMMDTGLAQFDCAADYPSLVEDVTWTFSKTEHGLIENPFLRIDFLEITDVSKPEEGDPCVNLHDNDSFIPLEIGPDEPGWTRLILADGTVMLNGPEIDGAEVMGRAGLASMATACEGKGCSSLAMDLDVEPGAWRLEGLRLHSEGASKAGNGAASVGVDEYTVSLFSPVLGLHTDGGYEIGAGAGVFSLSGRTAFGDYSLTATNLSRIMLLRGPSGWVMPPFELGYTDQNWDVWRLVIDASRWAPAPLR